MPRPSGSFNEPCSGGTPTPFTRGTALTDFLCNVGINNPQEAMQHTSYRGVTLDSDKRTTAVVYVNTFTVPPGDPNLKINVELSGTLNGQSQFTKTPDEVMAAAKALYPGGARLDFGTYSPSTIDIDAASKVTVDKSGNCVGTVGTASGGQATRVCRWYAIDALMQQWVADNPARLDFCGLYCVRIRMYDAVLGVPNYDSGGGILGCTAGSFCPEPGFQHPSATTSPK